MKWCNPCALMWVVILSAFGSHVWLHVDWTYGIAAAIVLIPAIAVWAIKEREDAWWMVQNLIAEVWWLLKNRPESQRPLHLQPSAASSPQEKK